VIFVNYSQSFTIGGLLIIAILMEFQFGELIVIVIYVLDFIWSNSALHPHQSEHEVLIKFMEDLENKTKRRNVQMQTYTQRDLQVCSTVPIADIHINMLLKL
jgi:hypothetical protein